MECECECNHKDDMMMWLLNSDKNISDPKNYFNNKIINELFMI